MAVGVASSVQYSSRPIGSCVIGRTLDARLARASSRARSRTLSGARASFRRPRSTSFGTTSAPAGSSKSGIVLRGDEAALGIDREGHVAAVHQHGLGGESVGVGVEGGGLHVDGAVLEDRLTVVVTYQHVQVAEQVALLGVTAVHAAAGGLFAVAPATCPHGLIRVLLLRHVSVGGGRAAGSDGHGGALAPLAAAGQHRVVARAQAAERDVAVAGVQRGGPLQHHDVGLVGARVDAERAVGRERGAPRYRQQRGYCGDPERG